MAQPTPYTRQFSFTNAFASSPTQVFPGAALDLELNVAKSTLDEILQSIKLIQNDDGTVKNGSIGSAQLSVALQTGFLPPTVWSFGVAYSASPASTVFTANKFYSCIVSHTSSSVFANDLAAGKWTLIADLSNIPLQTANNISVTPVGGIVLTDAQSVMAGLDTRITSNTNSLANLTSASLTDSTATGRALMTAASADAALSTLNSWSTGDTKLTFKTVADTNWVMADDSTIGPVGSGATHMGAAFQPLFNLFYANIADADAAVLTSAGAGTTRGAQGAAATAWANLCRMSLPKTLGRALGVAGAGSGLTSRALGHVVGEEAHALTLAENGPHTHATDVLLTPNVGGVAMVGLPFGAATYGVTSGTNNSVYPTSSYAAENPLSGTFASVASGSGTAHNNMQPTSFLNLMIKL